MPQRSNLFQDVVAIIHRHMAEGATVEESAMLTNRITNQSREVDVVITSAAASHPVIVSVEASATSRPATVEWVERMVGKHADLPTDKLVLVSEAGFRAAAREYAAAKGVTAISPEDLAEGDPELTIVNRLHSIWPKVLSMTPTSARIFVERPGEDVKWFNALPDHLIFTKDAEEVGTLLDVFKQLYDANSHEVFEQIGLADIAEDTTAQFVFQVGPGWTVTVNGEQQSLYVRNEDVEPPELHRIDRLMFIGTADIQVSEVSLTHARLGEVMYSFGEGTVGGREALLLFTETEEGGTGTIRIRPDEDEEESGESH